MSASEHIQRYIRDGPDAGGDSLAKRFLGALLWWRIWLTGLIYFTGIIILYTQKFLVDDRLWGFLIGAFTLYAIQIITPDQEDSL